MKRLISFLVLMICLTVLSGCSHFKIAKAATAFNDSEYRDVITLLADVESDDPNVVKMRTVATAFVAYEEQDYQTVVDLLSDIDDPDAAYQEMLNLSKANLLFANKQYLDVITVLANLETKTYYDVYSRSVNALIDEVISESDTVAAAALLNADAQAAGQLYDAIVEACEEYSYEGFLLAEALVAELPASGFRSDLEHYLSDNSKNKIKAFLCGQWQMNYSESDAAIVEIHVNEEDDKCFGLLIQTSEYMKDFSYETDDMYWCDFIFEGDLPVSVSHLVRSSGGSSYYTLSSFKLDLENRQILVHVSGTTLSDRVWNKIS